MTMRKQTQAELIEDIKVELSNRKNSLERLLNKLEESGWTKDEKELADEHVKFIKKYAPIVKDFYSPAIVIAE